MEVDRHERRVKIRLENHDGNLGWYTSASLSLPLHQIPLLEQALSRMKSELVPGEPSTGRIVSFPGLK